jgi:hypothetical protein
MDLFERSFTEEEYDTLVDYINFNAKRAKFDSMTDEEVITRYKMLSMIQKNILPKMQAHILELKEVTKAPPAKAKAKAGGSRTKSGAKK